MNCTMLGRWIRAYSDNTGPVFAGNGNPKDSDDDLRRLRRQLADTQMERDILKKLWPLFCLYFLPL